MKLQTSDPYPEPTGVPNIWIVFFAPSSSAYALPHLKNVFQLPFLKPSSESEPTELENHDFFKPRAIPVAIGPTTATYLRDRAGLQLEIVCKKPEAAALVAAIENYRLNRWSIPQTNNGQYGGISLAASYIVIPPPFLEEIQLQLFIRRTRSVTTRQASSGGRSNILLGLCYIQRSSMKTRTGFGMRKAGEPKLSPKVESTEKRLRQERQLGEFGCTLRVRSLRLL